MTNELDPLLLPLAPWIPPAPMPWWPIAPGLWLICLGLITTIGGALIYRYYRQHHCRRLALKTLKQTYQQYLKDQDTAQLMQTMNQIIRRVAIHQHPTIAGVCGRPWLQYLDRTMTKAEFTMGVGQYLCTQAYQAIPQLSAEEVAVLYQLTRNWIKKQ